MSGLLRHTEPPPLGDLAALAKAPSRFDGRCQLPLVVSTREMVQWCSGAVALIERPQSLSKSRTRKRVRTDLSERCAKLFLISKKSESLQYS